MIDLEDQLKEHLRRRADAAIVRYDLDAVRQGIDTAGFVRHDDLHDRRPWVGVLVGAAAAALVGFTVLGVLTRNDEPIVPTDVERPTSMPAPSVETSLPSTTSAETARVFSGTWSSTDTDGSTQSMGVVAAGDGSAQITISDAAATVCAGFASTTVGAGRVVDSGDLVVEAPAFTCDDGSEPAVLSPPVGDQLRNLTFAHDQQADTLTDSLGIVWIRQGSDDPSPASSAPAATTASETSGAPTESAVSGGMWPQSRVDDVKDAQVLADASDPSVAWQVDPLLSSEEWWQHVRDRGTAIVARFLRDELGWEHFLFNPYVGDDGDGAMDGVLRGLVYLRCAPGETNPLYPTTPEAPGAERCAPTLDDVRYETVSIDLSQLDRRGPSGIWVVNRWAIITPFAQVDPAVVVAEGTSRLEEFARARISGSGAEDLVDAYAANSTIEEVPLLYATSDGASYERSEIERSTEPQWPYGDTEFTVRLFAADGATVVEQPVSLRGGRLYLDAAKTTENRQPLPLKYTLFDGDVTVSAPNPWQFSPFYPVALTLGDQSGDERVEFVADPFPVATGCARGPAPADATSLVELLRSDPDLDVGVPSDVSIGGFAGVALDVTVAPGASVCDSVPSPQVLTQNDSHRGPGPPGVNLDPGSRMRLLLLDLPEGSTAEIFAIAVVAPAARFDAVVDAAAPIIESIEFES